MDNEGLLGKLRDKLLDEERKAASDMQVGDILYVSLDRKDGLKLNKGYDTRLKYIVIVGVTSNGFAVGVLYINSKIDPSKLSEGFFECQYRLLKSDYEKILDYDSWLDCSFIKEYTKEHLIDKGAMKKGELTDEDFDKIRKLLRETPVIRNSEKKRFGII